MDSGKQERNIKGSNYQPPPTTILCTIFWFNAHTKLSSSLPTSQVKPLAGTRAVTQVDLSWVGCRRRRSRRRRRRGCTSPVSCFVPRPLRTAPSLPPSQRLEAAPQSSSGHPTQRPARPVAGLQWSQHLCLKLFYRNAFKNPLFNSTVPESDLPPQSAPQLWSGRWWDCWEVFGIIRWHFHANFEDAPLTEQQGPRRCTQGLSGARAGAGTKTTPPAFENAGLGDIFDHLLTNPPFPNHGKVSLNKQIRGNEMHSWKWHYFCKQQLQIMSRL